MAKLKTKRRCKLGDECGMSCINKNKVCHKDPPKSLQPEIEKIAKKIKSKKTTVYVIPSDEEIAKMKILGRGAYGQVVLDEKNNVAIKIPNPEERDSKIEIAIGKKAGELGIGPKVLSTAKRKSVTLVAMEYLEGKTTAKLEKREKLTTDQTKQLIDNVRTLHTNGISHNDLHGGNIIIQKDGKMRILDYGLAQESYRGALREAINLDAMLGKYVINPHGSSEVKYALIGAVENNYRKYTQVYNNLKATDAELKSAIEGFYTDLYKNLP